MNSLFGPIGPLYRAALRVKQVDVIALLMLAAGCWLYYFYYTHTTVYNFGMDLNGHLHYIRYISKYNELPLPHKGWTSYHPPLYYLITGELHQWFRAERWGRAMERVRILSLVCYGIYLCYAYFCLRMVTPSRSAGFYAGWALLLFWPIGIVLASRVDSNVMFYPLFAACLYHLMRWHRYLRRPDLIMALVLTGIALLVRSSALVMAAMIGITVLKQWAYGRISARRLCEPALLLCALLLPVAWGVNVTRVVLYQPTTPHLLVANFHKLGRDMHVRNSLENYLAFDVRKFFNPPFFNTRRNWSGRQLFWVSLLKTSLYGEFRWRYVNMAQGLNFLLLLLLGYIAGGWAVASSWWTQSPRRRQRRHGFFVPGMTLLLLLGASMGMRYIYPSSSTQDFRYIYPALIAVAMLFAAAVRRYEQYRIPGMARFGVLLAFCFCAWSAVFVLLNTGWTAFGLAERKAARPPAVIEQQGGAVIKRPMPQFKEQEEEEEEKKFNLLRR